LVKLAGLLSGYLASLACPEEKDPLGSNSEVRAEGQVIDRKARAGRILCLMHDLQRDIDHQVALM
jgi:hypothetical protein